MTTPVTTRVAKSGVSGVFAGVTYRVSLRLVAVARGRRGESLSLPPETVMTAKLRARANKLTDSERAALMGDAMRIIYSAEGDAVRAHRRCYSGVSSLSPDAIRCANLSQRKFVRMVILRDAAWHVQ